MEKELKESEQIIEGVLPGYYSMYTEELEKYLEKVLPSGIASEQVDIMGASGSKKEWHWHLKPEYIKDDQEREKYSIQRKLWPRD